MAIKVKVPHNALVLVSDGRKALFLKNKGDEVYPNFQMERVLHAPENPPTQLQGTDKPGRVSMFGSRSSIDQTDWHTIAEQKFAGQVAEIVNAACFNGTVNAVVVAAPPRTLAELRNRFSDKVRQLVLAEVTKDLTKHPVYEIEQHIIHNV